MTKSFGYSIISTVGVQQAGMAQSVAHLIGSEEVTGSIPVASFIKPLYLQGFFIIGFSQLSVTEFFVFRKMESHETKNHLLCGWCSKCL